jgi:RNA polymerase sigma-70 factor (ECF subfamily)
MEVVLDAEAVLVGSRQSLVDAAVSGDREAFAALVGPELASALGGATIIAGSHADGADAVQEALLSAWLGLDALRDPDAFPAWFRRHVVRAAVRIARGRARVFELDPSQLEPDGGVDRALAERQLARAFAKLEPGDRAVLTLRQLWDLPVDEASAVLGVPPGTVKSRLHHAMTRLRAAFDAEDRR